MEGNYTCSFNVNAFMKIKFDELKAIMDGFPGATLIQRGTMLKYLIKEGEAKLEDSKSSSTKSNNYKNEKLKKRSSKNLIMLELRKDNITAIFYTDDKEKREVLLLKFFSILAYLKRAYDVYINSLYEEILHIITPYVLLQHENEFSESAEDNYKKIIQELSASNYKLSNDIINLSKYNTENMKRLKLLTEFYNQVIAKFSINTFNLNNKFDALVHLGIDKKLLEELSKLDFDIKNTAIKKRKNSIL
ncbi:MAG: hypothetical protein ACP5LH_02165 [Candidatus Micrarchaeia archaeon]